MSVETLADRRAMLADFGEEIGWTVGATLWPLTVLADSGTIRLEGVDSASFNRHASVQLAEADIPVGAAEGDAVTFRGTAHTVKTIEPDGTGMAMVRLELVVAD